MTSKGHNNLGYNLITSTQVQMTSISGFTYISVIHEPQSILIDLTSSIEDSEERPLISILFCPYT